MTKLKFDNLQALKAACSDEHAEALDRAKREMGTGGVFQSRGRHILAYDAKGDVIAGEAESWPWNGTVRQLFAAIEDARNMGAHRVEIRCGINWAASPQAMADYDYEPWVEEWGVEVWGADEVPTATQSE